MQSTATANWYPDPDDPSQLRYWDGSRWTEHRSPATSGVTAGAPPETGTSDPAQNSGSVPDQPGRARGGLFGGKKALEQEVEELRELVAGFGYAERTEMQRQIDELTARRDALTAEIAATQADLDEMRTVLVVAREEQMLQEVGVYDYHHVLENAVAYQLKLDSIRRRIKEVCKADGGAVTGATAWTVNGSASQGRKMVREFSKLLLRAYNNEADDLVARLRPYKLEASVDRLIKSRATITKLGATMSIQISEAYHELRAEELVLTADYLQKKEEEKEADRAEKERLREEAKAKREFEAEKARLLKEQQHYANALEKLRQGAGSAEQIAEAELQLAQIDEAIHGVEEREANIRAGYVYVISNIGSFGREVVKIGMTRRLEPLDRIRELGDASVPFRYDIHALVFSDDAVSLETHLHQTFADRRLNLVNQRREFFYATPAAVRDALLDANGALLEFVEEPEADEWFQSQNARRASSGSPEPNDEALATN